MPIVIDNTAISEVRSLAQRAGQGDRVEREEALRVSRLNRQLAQGQFELQTQAQLFNQDLALARLADQRANTESALQIEILNRQERQQQQEFENAISAATQQRVQEDFEFRRDRDRVNTALSLAREQREREQDAVELDQARQDADFEQARIDLQQRRVKVAEQSLQTTRQEADAQLQRRQAEVDQNMAAVRNALPFLPPESVPGMELAARHERPDQFASFLNDTIAKQDQALSFPEAMDRARSAVDAKIKEVESRISAMTRLSNSTDPLSGEQGPASVRAKALLPQFLGELESLLNDKRSLNPLDSQVTIQEYERLTGDNSRSTLIRNLARRNTSNRFLAQARQTADQEVAFDAQLRGQEPRQATDPEVTQVLQRMTVDESTGRRNAQFEFESEKEMLRLLNLYGWTTRQ